AADYEGTLTLWYSPLAGKSTNYRDRNFSNRDDHVSVFDWIRFPGLGESTFKGCTYDPFHTVVHFEGQDLHLVPHLEEPALIVWATEAQAVDFRSGAED